MVACDSSRVPDPEKLLRPETAAALVAALQAQLAAGEQPTAQLSDAIRAAAREARDRELPAEGLIIQLKHIADSVAGPLNIGDDVGRRQMRHWMVSMSLRAYWDS